MKTTIKQYTMNFKKSTPVRSQKLLTCWKQGSHIQWCLKKAQSSRSCWKRELFVWEIHCCIHPKGTEIWEEMCYHFYVKIESVLKIPSLCVYIFSFPEYTLNFKENSQWQHQCKNHKGSNHKRKSVDELAFNPSLWYFLH